MTVDQEDQVNFRPYAGSSKKSQLHLPDQLSFDFHNFKRQEKRAHRLQPLPILNNVES